MEKPLDQSATDYWRDIDFDELQRLIQRMRAVRIADAKLVREIEALGQDEPNDPLQTQAHVSRRTDLGPL